MADFSRPEYASYVQLCRELRLERTFQEGDRYLWVPSEDERLRLLQVGGIGVYLGDTELFTAGKADEWYIWLPTLADWLEMLKEAGVAGVDFHFEPPGASIHRYGKHAATERELALLMRLHEVKPSSLEEAAARLWMAVKKG